MTSPDYTQEFEKWYRTLPGVTDAEAAKSLRRGEKRLYTNDWTQCAYGGFEAGFRKAQEQQGDKG